MGSLSFKLIILCIVIIGLCIVVLFTNVDKIIIDSIEIDMYEFYLITDTYPVNSICDVYLVKTIEFKAPKPSQWYIDNFSEEQKTLMDGIATTDWANDHYSSIMTKYIESINKKTVPKLQDYIPKGNIPDVILRQDPECYEIMSEKYPTLIGIASDLTMDDIKKMVPTDDFELIK